MQPSGTRILVRDPGDVVDPDLLSWRLRGPCSVQREPAPEEVVRRRIREEDEHIRRYMNLLDRQYNNGWSFLQRVPPHVSYDPVRVPYLLFGCAAPATQHPAARDPVEVSFRGSCISDIIRDVLGLNKNVPNYSWDQDVLVILLHI